MAALACVCGPQLPKGPWKCWVGREGPDHPPPQEVVPSPAQGFRGRTEAGGVPMRDGGDLAFFLVPGEALLPPELLKGRCTVNPGL